MQEARTVKQRLLEANNKVKLFIGVVVVAIALLLAFHNYQAKAVLKGPRSGDIKPAVDVLIVQRKDMLKKIELTGQTVPEAQVDIAAKYSGKIIQVNVELGQRVVPGQVLIVQDTNDIDAALTQNEAALRGADADAMESNASFEASYQKAQADYQRSVTNYQRYNTLYETGAVSRENLDNVEQQMTNAKAALDTWSNQLVSGSAASVLSKQAVRDKTRAALDALQNQRNDMIWRAPRAGVIGFRQAEVGNMTQPGQKLLSIIDNSKIYVDCVVSEQDIGQIVIGMPAKISIDSLGKSYTGKIIYSSPAMDSKTQSFTVRLALDNVDDTLKAGMFARTDINVVLRTQTLFVPKEAVSSLNGKERVFIVDGDNKIMERVVQVGLRNDKSVEILNGVGEGEKVAITNLSRLKNGINVNPNVLSE